MGLPPPEAHLRAGDLRGAPGGLVARRLHHRVVTGPQDAQRHREQHLHPGGVDEEVVGPQPGMQIRQRLSHLGPALALRVSAPDLPQGIDGTGFQGQEVPHRHGLAVRHRQEVGRGELVLREEALQEEGLHAHGIRGSGERRPPIILGRASSVHRTGGAPALTHDPSGPTS